METSLHPRRLIESKKFYFLFWVLFIAVFYATWYIYSPELTSTSKIGELLTQYGVFVPLAVGVLIILKSYILQFIIYILHINHWISKVCIYLLIYGFWLTLGIQLRYFEPRFTDVAIVLIDQYALPLMTSSGVVIMGVLLLSLIKKR